MGTVEGSCEALEEGKALAEGWQVQRCGAVKYNRRDREGDLHCIRAKQYMTYLIFFAIYHPVLCFSYCLHLIGST